MIDLDALAQGPREWDLVPTAVSYLRFRQDLAPVAAFGDAYGFDLLAWAGWPTLIAGTFAGFLIGAIYGLALLVTRRATRQQRIPFGPFMIAGAFLALLAH